MSFKYHLALIVGVCQLLCSAQAFAGRDRADELCSDCSALGKTALDDVRGGLQLGNGLLVSFGLERSVLVNGELASTTTLNTSLSSGELTAFDLQRSASSLIQVGDNNQLSAAAIANLRGGIGSVVQNSMDQQVIQNMTIIDIVVRNIDYQSTAPALQNGTLYELIWDAVQ